jgi:hypothetical protein
MTTQIVDSEVSYLGPCLGKPVFYGRQQHLDNLPLEKRKVRIRDLRNTVEATALDREGFALLRHPSTVTDFFDSALVHGTYLRESEELVRLETGAVKVVASIGCVIRRSERSPSFRKDGTSVLGRFAHCDFSPNPAGSDFWVMKMLPPEEAKERLTRRYAIYNLWRVLSDPPQDTPLALCDARSVEQNDCVNSDCVVDPPDEPELRFENCIFRFNPSHKWCYFSNMTRDEVLVFKGFDSNPNRAGGVPHVAFDNPSCPVDAPARESIDVRVIAFFDEIR